MHHQRYESCCFNSCYCICFIVAIVILNDSSDDGNNNHTACDNGKNITTRCERRVAPLPGYLDVGAFKNQGPYEYTETPIHLDPFYSDSQTGTPDF